MKKSWIWILVIFAGSLPVGSALQYYFAAEAGRNSSSRNWAVIGQAVFGILVMALGLYKQIKAGKLLPPEIEAETKLVSAIDRRRHLSRLLLFSSEKSIADGDLSPFTWKRNGSGHYLGRFNSRIPRLQA